MLNMLELLNSKILKVFENLNYNEKYAFFQYSDRPDLSDFQINSAMQLCKALHKSPVEIANTIVEELKKTGLFNSITINGPGFINVKLKDEIFLNYLNKIILDEKCGYEHNRKNRKVLVDFCGANLAKEMHVGHLRSTVIGESIRRIYEFCGDEVIGDMHQGDWGSNMGVVIESIKLKYPDLKCFKENFNEDTITDLNIDASELTEIYRFGSSKSKEDEDFLKRTREATKLLQDGYKPYRILWQYFANVSLNDIKSIACDIFNAHFDLLNGESAVHDLIVPMMDDLTNKGFITISNGAKIIDLEKEELLPVIMEKSDGASMYSTTDMATILDRKTKYQPDLILYVVDGRQSLYFKQIFAAAKKVGYLDETIEAEHCPFGTMNGKDGRPYKTRSGDIVKLRYLVNETIEKISEKSRINDKETVKNIAVACIKFADLINFREMDYIFDLDKFTNYEGKTGAYILYSLVRINSILDSISLSEKNLKITEIKTKEEKELIMELTKFNIIITNSYDKKAPSFIADYVYSISKKFSSFYANCKINNEIDEEYKKSKISLLFLTKKCIELCIYLLGISKVDKM